MKKNLFLTYLFAASLTFFGGSSIAAAPQNFPSQIPGRYNLPVNRPNRCATSTINQGAKSSHPGLAVSKALQGWDAQSERDGFFSFESSKDPKISVIKIPSNQYLWKANIIAIPCR